MRATVRAWWHALRTRGGLGRVEPAGGGAPCFRDEVRGPVEEWVSAHRAGSTRTYGTLDHTSGHTRSEDLRAAFPERVRATIEAADRAVDHCFEFLGSGPFRPVDPDRDGVPGVDPSLGYTPIDWTLDPVRGLRFPNSVPHEDYDLGKLRPGLADVKYPWELARGHHLVTLSQAYQITGETRYAREIIAQIRDFTAANRAGFGVNWICTMDVGIRAANWVLALEGLRDCADVSHADFAFAHEACFDHGRFVRANLEDHYEVTSNHYLSNLLGLRFLGLWFADLPSGREWGRFSRAAVEEEIGKQVHPDGTDFESSVAYHRLVTELFLASARLAECEGSSHSSAFLERVGDMVRFLTAVECPDGRLPLVGDADDGRLHIFTDGDAWDRRSARHLLGPASAMLDIVLPEDPDGRARWETLWWGLDPNHVRAGANAHVSAEFPDIGIAVRRESGSFLLITNGRVGTEGFGNHKHNELLSFELHLDGHPIVIDPGSGVYTGDPDLRNRYRSTRIHNTLTVDGAEQNEIVPEWLFRMFETSGPQRLDGLLGNDATPFRWAGRHHGFLRLPKPVLHERAFHFEAGSRRLLWVDRVSGEGVHDLIWHLHLAPGVSVPEPVGSSGAVELAAGSHRYHLRIPEGIVPELVDSAVSPSYGVERPCRALDLMLRTDVGAAPHFVFSIVPEEVSAPDPENLIAWFGRARAAVAPLEAAIESPR